MEQLDKSLTARLYQAGLDIEKAVSLGANWFEFEQLEKRFQGSSIPLHLFRGIKYQAPYSCEYHSGGKQGELLRTIVKEQREAKL